MLGWGCWTMLSHVEPCWATIIHEECYWSIRSIRSIHLGNPCWTGNPGPPKMMDPGGSCLPTSSARGGGWAVEDWSSAALGLSPAGAASLWGPLQHLFPGKRWYATRDEEPGCIGLGSGQKSGAELEMEGGTKKAGRSMVYGYLNCIWSYLIIVIVHANQDLLRNILD